MNIKYSVCPEHAKTLDTNGLRNAFHVSDLFITDEISMTYAYDDRMIVFGVAPLNTEVLLDAGNRFGTDYFLQRREAGVINIGGPGCVIADGITHELGNEDALYLGTGIREARFLSFDEKNPALFYGNSAAAHRAFPAKKIQASSARRLEAGNEESANKRTIIQYLHPEVLETCQLSMGLTKLAPKSVWNTMPVHTHERRMEVYFYFGMQPGQIVFHLLGHPSETRHIVMREKEAVISPSWSIHSGVGTSSYNFIWGMAGENRNFTDMDSVDIKVIK